MHPYVHSNSIHNSQDMETTYMSINRWMDKDVVRIYKGILLNHNKEQNSIICNNMGTTEIIILSEVSQKEKDRCYMVSLMCGI